MKGNNKKDPAPQSAKVVCATCGREFVLISNPHVEGIKYCSCCNSEDLTVTHIDDVKFRCASRGGTEIRVRV